jgi:(1->4)-alpha-D-glucan 1-alpha-D-glucosylmutase
MNKMPTLALKIPVSTYRLQFNGLFKFSDAKNIIHYLYDLGITDIYASPYFKAKKGSMHGYDIVDQQALNPEIGTEEEYDSLIEELKSREMGQILDIVPNHMCITSKDNAWWMDVLENGPSSQYANYFDIDWEPVKKELTNKILLPVLGNQYGTVLESQELRLFFENGSFFLGYFDERFPVRPQTYIMILQYRIEKLEDSVNQDSPSFMEFLSIITALKNLPSYLETALQKVNERNREKEIAKKRLWQLYCKDPEIKSFIDTNINIFNGTRGETRSFDLLDQLISEQIYRLSYWPVATEEINYRRFFDINSLGAIRMERPEVFEETHNLIFRLIKEKKVTGLRVDHPDGLYNPSEYFYRLQYNCFKNIMLGHVEQLKEDVRLPYCDNYIESEITGRFEDLQNSEHGKKVFYIVGEKILIKSEKMPEEWPIFSTTGYVFLNSLNGIFIETRNSKVFDRIYAGFIKSKMDYQEIVYQNKKLIIEAAMASEINTLGHYLNRISEKNRHTRDFTLNSLIKATTEVIAFFPVYRTYTSDWSVKNRDQQYIDIAVSKAKRKNPSINASIFDFLHDILLLRLPDTINENEKKECLDFVMRFQQLTGPVMAKGLEDTTFYVYNRLTSMNEVGGSPERFGTTLETFHGQNIERQKFWPHALIATSTHDTKRSEDMRARINVLSEIPDQWKLHLLNWSKLNKNKKIAVEGHAVPDRNEEYFLYQTLIGTWPIHEMHEEEQIVFETRIKEYMLKAIHEAKINSSWTNPHILYEEAVIVFVNSLIRNMPDNEFLKDFIPFQKMVSQYGIYNSLSQSLLKITSPGIPDFYQGTELWDFSLVDPDNRRPVNYDIRINMLDEIKDMEKEKGCLNLANSLAKEKENGKIKLYLIYKALNFRKQFKRLFDDGNYIPLELWGGREQNVCAFARQLGNDVAIIAVPRLLAKILKDPGQFPFEKEVWGDSFLTNPFGEKDIQYLNIFTDERLFSIEKDGMTGLYLADVFANFPVALLKRLE